MKTCWRTVRRALLMPLLLMLAGPCMAYDHIGHETVAALAAKYMGDSNASRAVRKLLDKVGPDVSIEQAAVWADCVKGVNTRTMKYVVAEDKVTHAKKYPECAVFETPAGQALMERYVSRHAVGCHETASACHSQYHYSDVAIQRAAFAQGRAGRADVDVVNALDAAIAALTNTAAPATPIALDDYEALLLILHLVGDIHQPLHVGAIYLDQQGRMVDPDQGAADPLADTSGGNYLMVKPFAGQSPGQMHRMWDHVSREQAARLLEQPRLEQLRTMAVSPGPLSSWPGQWADDTLLFSKLAFEGVGFSTATLIRNDRGQHNEWTADLPRDYAGRVAMIQDAELQRAGARLGQLLMAIFP